MMRSPLLAACAAMALVGTAQAGTASGSYTNSFTNGLGGNAYGAAGHISQFGGDMQLIGDYSGFGGQYNGTWTTGGLSMPGANGPISSFNASFRFAFNNNSNGDATADGFSFLFGNLSDGMNDQSDSGHGYQNNWHGGEWGLNNFSRLNEGLSVGFRAYGGSQGLTARWGRGYGGEGLFSVDNNQSGGWLDSVVYGYNNAANGADGRAGQAGSWDAANLDATQATAYISWAEGGDLVVSIAFPGNSPVEYMRTSAFSGIAVGENFTFGLAARIGGASWDVQIDDFNVDYQYSTPVVPGPAGIAALAGLATMRRRRR
jgi:hypothetical protein